VLCSALYFLSKNNLQDAFGMVPSVSTDDVSQVMNVVLAYLGLFLWRSTWYFNKTGVNVSI
jgi:hypothetical protein